MQLQKAHLIPGKLDTAEELFTIPEEFALKALVLRRPLDFGHHELTLGERRDGLRELLGGESDPFEADEHAARIKHVSATSS